MTLKKLFCLTLTIHGLVQGVWFRDFAIEEAKRLGLVGWVKNNPDGTVGIIAEGEKAKLEEFKAWCQRGPELARVEKIEEGWKEIEKLSFKKFL